MTHLTTPRAVIAEPLGQNPAGDHDRVKEIKDFVLKTVVVVIGFDTKKQFVD